MIISFVLIVFSRRYRRAIFESLNCCFRMRKTAKTMFALVLTTSKAIHCTTNKRCCKRLTLSQNLLVTKMNLNRKISQRNIILNLSKLSKKIQVHLFHSFAMEFYWLCLLSRIRRLKPASMINCRVSSWMLQMQMNMSGRP